jgi:hypothetical protein
MSVHLCVNMLAVYMLAVPNCRGDDISQGFTMLGVMRLCGGLTLPCSSFYGGTACCIIPISLSVQVLC